MYLYSDVSVLNIPKIILDQFDNACNVLMDFMNQFLYTYKSEIYDQETITNLSHNDSLYILLNEINSDQEYCDLICFESGERVTSSKVCNELRQIGYYVFKVYIFF